MSTHQKRGRKKLADRERYACGQVKPALSVTGAQWQRMRSITKNPMLATHLGRMGFLGELTAEEVACGEKIGRVYGAFDKALGRRRFARSPGYELGRGRSADGEETEVGTERTATAIKRMTFLENEIEAVAALIFPGLRGQLELLCVEDELPTAGVMPLVKRALAALAGPLGIRAAMARRKPDNTRAERDRN